MVCKCCLQRSETVWHVRCCHRYPDMLMIGVQGQCPDEGGDRLGPWSNGFKQPTVTEQRTHFGLWCTLSAPLTLSLDFTNKTATDSVWHIITNTHAIAVNQVLDYCFRAQRLLSARPDHSVHLSCFFCLLESGMGWVSRYNISSKHNRWATSEQY